ncbi:MAG: ABC transporter permease, partial [Anaerolineales bacterium]|nr:ABC transporter permease [Anaerolineales bacterium]
MRNVLIVLKHEFLTTIQKPSFWLTTFLLPAVVVVMQLFTQVIAADAFEPTTNLIPGADLGAAVESSTAAHPPIIGYVDDASLLGTLPPGIPAGLLRAFDTETAAQTALQAEEISEYYVIPADFRDTGDIVQVSAEFDPFNVGTDDLMNYLLLYGLTGDAAKAAAFVDPTYSVPQYNLAPRQPTDNGASSGSPLAFFVPFAVMFIFFFLITMSSGFMLQSVSREKENRTAEVLLLSLRPRELMLGKILGLSGVALLQLG